MDKWEDSGRDDLKFLPKMVLAGWIPEFHESDVRYGRVTPEYPPMTAVSFTKGFKLAWKAYRNKGDGIVDYWQVADLVDGYVKNHRPYESLCEVIAGEK